MVIEENRSIRSVAKNYGVDHCTLHVLWYVKKQGEGNMNSNHQRPCQDFTPQQENELFIYIKQASNIYFGFSLQNICILAYQCVDQFQIRMPPSWSASQRAGIDRLRSFLDRHQSLSVTVPEATNLARASNFSKEIVKQFFDKLAEIMDRYKSESQDIWNFYETGISTVQKPKKIVAMKGTKQVGAIIPAELGMVTPFHRCSFFSEKKVQRSFFQG